MGIGWNHLSHPRYTILSCLFVCVVFSENAPFSWRFAEVSRRRLIGRVEPQKSKHSTITPTTHPHHPIVATHTPSDPLQAFIAQTKP